MATDIIARGMAASSVRPGSDGKIPAEYLPSYVDDIVDLLTISDTAPATCAEGDKYYNSTSKLIFTATGTNTWGTTGETPASGIIYINTAEDPSGSYRWDGLNLVLIGASGGQTIQYTEMPTAEAAIEGEIVQYIGDTDSTYTNGYFYQCVEDNGSYLWENINVQPNTIGKDIYLFVSGESSATSLATGQAILDYYNTKGTMPVVYFQPSSNARTSYCECVFAGKPNNNYSLRFQVYQFDDMSNQYFGTPVLNYWGMIYMHCDTAFTTVNTVSFPTALGNTNYHRSFRPLAGYQRGINNVPSSSQAYANEDMALTITNTKAYTPAIGSYNPATAKFVTDTVAAKTILLNYDSGNYDTIYLDAANTLGTTTPSVDVESGNHGPAYTMEYTYTSAQSITPATKYIFHLTKILKGNKISGQDISISAYIVRNNTAVLTKENVKIGTIPETTGTTDVTTVTVEGRFGFELENTFAIQNGDIFRLVVASSYTGDYYLGGAIYSSSTTPTYVSQYSGGVNAEYVYDTINGTTYSQHDINAMSGGSVPMYLITGTTQADVDKINECCNLFTQNKPFTAYYKSTAAFGPKYVPITFFTMGTSDIFMNFIGWAGYSGNGQTLVWGQIQGTGTPGQYSAIQIYDDPSSYKEVIDEKYFSNLTNYSAYKNQVLENNNGTLNWIDGSINPTVITDNNATYTIASLTGNKVYKLGELTDLTITAITTFDRESIIYFSSGSTPTDISIPDSLTNLGDVPTLTTASNVSTGTCEANKSYIIAVLNNIAVWKAY